MSSYIKRNLGHDEKVIMVAVRSSWRFIPMIFSIVLQVVLAFALCSKIVWANQYFGLGITGFEDIIVSTLFALLCIPVVIKTL